MTIDLHEDLRRSSIRPLPASDAAATALPRWMATSGFVVIGAQFVVLCLLSRFQLDRFSETRDFAAYYQPWTLIAHGFLDPPMTVWGHSFVSDHGSVIFYVLAQIGRIWSGPYPLLLVQDVAAALASVVAFSWVVDLVQRPGWPARLPPVLATTAAVVFLVADPWVYWSNAFDFHAEILGGLFALLTLRAFERGHYRTVFLWFVLLLACGDVAATYAAGIGLTMLLWRRWTPGFALVGAGACWVVLLSVLHLSHGSGLQSFYGYLAYNGSAPAHATLLTLAGGILSHPARVARALWYWRVDLWANLAPAGLLGVVSSIGFGMALLVLVPAVLATPFGAFAAPAMQEVAVIPFVAVGTFVVLGALGRRGPRWALGAAVLTVVLMANSVAWAAIWLPKTATRWSPVTPAAAAVLARAQPLIPPSAEVVASQGVMGPFAGRRWIFPEYGQLQYPLHTHNVWFVFAPSQGIEIGSAGSTLAMFTALVQEPGAQLMTHGAGVWVVKVTPRHDVRTLVLRPKGVGGWTSPGPAGRSDVAGPFQDWAAKATGAQGYVMAGDYFRETAGTYHVACRLSSAGPVNVEAWDATTNVLLWRQSLAGTSHTLTVAHDITLARTPGPTLYEGWGPFGTRQQPAARGDQIELRVWTPGGHPVSVYSVSVGKVKAQ